jgi:dTDP-4-amino-4,6-dideoxygalactose transaminase
LIPITLPLFGIEEEQAAVAAIRSGWVTQGPQVAAFERAVAEYCGAEHAVAVSNCTTALHLAMLVHGIGPRDEVICPSMSFIATANSIRYTGATPVFAEVEPTTYNLDPRAAEAAITPQTKAILVVHQIGLPAELDCFYAIGARHGLKIIEDAACAIGSKYHGRQIGGDAETVCFSFHPRKVITTGEGGIITTNRADFSDRLRLLRQHGMSLSDTTRHLSQTVLTESYVCPGYNYRMTDIQAAIGVEQMKRLDWIVTRRRELADRYTAALSRHRWLRPPYVPDRVEPNFQSYAVQLTAEAPISRDDLMQSLLERGIATRRGIMLAHLEPACADLARCSLPKSEEASRRSLLLPLYAQMTDNDQEHVISALREISGPSHRGALRQACASEDDAGLSISAPTLGVGLTGVSAPRGTASPTLANHACGP